MCIATQCSSVGRSSSSMNRNTSPRACSTPTLRAAAPPSGRRLSTRTRASRASVARRAAASSGTSVLCSTITISRFVQVCRSSVSTSSHSDGTRLNERTITDTSGIATCSSVFIRVNLGDRVLRATDSDKRRSTSRGCAHGRKHAGSRAAAQRAACDFRRSSGESSTPCSARRRVAHTAPDRIDGRVDERQSVSATLRRTAADLRDRRPQVGRALPTSISSAVASASRSPPSRRQSAPIACSLALADAAIAAAPSDRTVPARRTIGARE